MKIKRLLFQKASAYFLFLMILAFYTVGYVLKLGQDLNATTPVKDLKKTKHKVKWNKTEVYSVNMVATHAQRTLWPSVSDPEETRREAALIKELDTIPLSIIYNWYNFWPKRWPTFLYDSNENKLTKCKRDTALPSMQEIVFKNKYWQYLEINNNVSTPMWIYSAHLDKRVLTHNSHVIRALNIHISPLPTSKSSFPPLYCHVWYKKSSTNVYRQNSNRVEDHRKIVVVKAKRVKHLLPYAGRYKDLMPSGIECNLPQINDSLPLAVSIEQEACIPSLKTAFSLENKYKDKGGLLAICLKQIYSISSDRTLRFMEWIETLRALKVEKILIYVITAHENLLKLFNHYTDEGFIQTIPITTPLDFQTTDWWIERELRRNRYLRRALENILQNDCFYRLHEYFRYVGVCDADEVFMPKEKGDLQEFLLSKEQQYTSLYKTAAYVFCGAYYPRFEHGNDSAYISEISYNGIKVPSDMLYMMTYVYRTEDRLHSRAKSIHNTAFRVWTGTHFGAESLGPFRKTKDYHLSWEEAFLAHYRGDIWRKSNFSNQKTSGRFHDSQLLIRDPLIWRFKNQVLTRMFYIIHKLFPKLSIDEYLSSSPTQQPPPG